MLLLKNTQNKSTAVNERFIYCERRNLQSQFEYCSIHTT